MSAKSILITLLIVVCGQDVFASDESSYPIAGTQPSHRPQGAPVIQPYPYSLQFLEDQGNWHTPFTHPGMHGRYDIRGWYRQ